MLIAPPAPPAPNIGRYLLVLGLVWTLLVGASLGWNLWRGENAAMENAKTQARIAFHKDVLYRRWNARHGGVYAPVAKGTNTIPNPYLKVPARDIEIPSGLKLTKINPAYMTRQVHELGAGESGVLGHITSLDPLRPENQADPWEEAALIQMRHGATEVSAKAEINGENYLRLMRPLLTEKSCLPCHAHQGYQLGEIRGGISVSVPLAPVLASLQGAQRAMVITHALLWAVVLFGLTLGARHLRRRVAERDLALAAEHQALEERRAAMSQVKQLSGLLPICANCKKIRNDAGYWNKIEEYIADHSDAVFSHSICPQCMEALYPELARRKDKDQNNDPPSVN